MTFSIPDADANLEICWDKIGIPHIFAQSTTDAFRGMGYACASERLWQLHLSNLYATGTAASVMGEKHVPQDLMHKVFNVAATDIPDSPGDYIVDAYLQGVNAYVDSLDEVPPEFLKAGTQPRHYTRHDVASRYRFTGWFQHKTWLEKIYLGKLMAEHGVDYFRDHVLRFSDEDAHCVETLKDSLLNIDLNVARLLFPHETRLSGSNNWAINGELSASGLPMLATDPHQPHSIPNTFFYSHLSAPGWDAFGASFPGVPYFMMGHNRDVSWGLTTGFVDTYDVFVEQQAPTKAKDYSIDIANQSSRNFSISESRHGPILESLTDALDFSDTSGHNKGESFTALDWAMRDQPTSAGILALMPLAKNSTQLGEALFENDVCPLVNNIICVDRHNDMHRYIATTVRHRSGSGKNHASEGVTGVVPLPGNNPKYDFGLSNAADLLVESNPTHQYVLTANNDTMGDNGNYPIHNFPTHDARAKRIEELLQGQSTKFSVEDFTSMQLDLTDVRARELVPDIIASLRTQPADERIQLAIQLLSQWDYVADIDSKAACIIYPLLEKRPHLKFIESVLGKSPLTTTLSAIAPGLNRFDINNFMSEGSPWLAHKDTFNKIIADDVIQIVEYLTDTFGNDWSWGSIHQIRFGHSLRKYEPWQHMQVGPDPIGGSPTTLRMAQHNPPATGQIEQEVYHGPAFRWVVDMAEPLKFKFIIAGGNGGRPDGDNISDHYDAWLKGDYFDMSLVREEIEIVRHDQSKA
ncbi:MAG: penicillin acylase family protein [Pseudomonadales bacterium]|nr:penicillin acylase family protein [Pseudomonadales bacterium]